MIVHFSTSSQELEERTTSVRAILETIKSEGHTIARDWLDEALNSTDSEKHDADRWSSIAKATIAALKKSDAVIIESTIDSFSMGYQAALARQLKKPLLLIRNGAYDKHKVVNYYSTDKKAESSLIVADYDELVMIDGYQNPKEAQEITRQFLKKNDLKKSDLRFNMFLDRKTYQYLNIEAAKTGKTRAKIIRDALESTINNGN